MPASIPKPPKQTLAFFSISVAWIINAIIYSIYQVIFQGITRDVEFMLAWSAMFAFVGWLVFIIYPLSKLKPGNIIFNLYICPVITGVYACLVYSLVIFALFENEDILFMYLPWAAIIGITFGLTLALLLKSEKLPRWLKKNPSLKVLSPLSPLILLAFFYILLPLLFPAATYRFMPKDVQNRISSRLLQRLRVGDPITPAVHALPDDPDGPKIPGANNGSYDVANDIFTFHADVKNDTIRSVKFHQN